MYNIKQKLIEEGIHINMNNPQQKTLCPKCSHKRKNNREPCLSVNIENDKALWHCHHCEWKGSVFEGMIRPDDFSKFTKIVETLTSKFNSPGKKVSPFIT